MSAATVQGFKARNLFRGILSHRTGKGLGVRAARLFLSNIKKANAANGITMTRNFAPRPFVSKKCLASLFREARFSMRKANDGAKWNSHRNSAPPPKTRRRNCINCLPPIKFRQRCSSPRVKNVRYLKSVCPKRRAAKVEARNSIVNFLKFKPEKSSWNHG